MESDTTDPRPPAPDEPEEFNEVEHEVKRPADVAASPSESAQQAPPMRNVPKCGARGVSHIYLFLPQDDITAREVAASMEIVLFGFAGMMGASPPMLVDQLYQNLSVATRRHWLVNELPKQQGPKIIQGDGGLAQMLKDGARRLNQGRNGRRR